MGRRTPSSAPSRSAASLRAPCAPTPPISSSSSVGSARRATPLPTSASALLDYVAAQRAEKAQPRSISRRPRALRPACSICGRFRRHCQKSRGYHVKNGVSYGLGSDCVCNWRFGDRNGVGIGAWQVSETRKLARSSFEDGLVKEYRELTRELPTDALMGLPLSEEDHRESLDDFSDTSTSATSKCSSVIADASAMRPGRCGRRGSLRTCDAQRSGKHGRRSR